MEEGRLGQSFEQIRPACYDHAITWKDAIRSENCMFLLEGQGSCRFTHFLRLKGTE